MTYRIEHLGVTLNVEVTPTLQALGDQPWRCVVKKEGDLFAEEARFFESDCGLNAALAGVAEQYKEEAAARSELAPPDAD